MSQVDEILNQTQDNTKSETPSTEDNDFLNALMGEDTSALNKDTKATEKLPTDGAERQEPVKPQSIAEVAERLGLKVEDVYALEIPLAGDGSKITIGKLKDQIEDVKLLEVNRLKFEEERVQFEAGATRAKDELATIVSKLKEAIPAKHFETLMEAGRAEHTAKLNEQRAKVFEYIPEWNDRDTLAREVAEIDAFLEPYFGKKAFAQFNNAKMIKLLRDVTKREQRVRQAISKMTEVIPESKSASRKAPTKTVTPTRRTSVDPRREFVDNLFK